MTSTRKRFGGLLAILAASFFAANAIAVTVPSNINGTFEVPAGEVGALIGTITFNDGILDVDGHLQRQSSSTTLTGTGQILLNAPAASMVNVCCGPTQMVIGPDIEILGQGGASINPWYMTNQGTIAAVAGGATGIRFTITSNNFFLNQGLLAARAGGVLRIVGLRSGNLATGSILRAESGGTIEVLAIGGSFTRLTDFGTVENLGGNIELRNVDLSNEGSVTTFAGGDWTLLSGSSIQGGIVNTAEGGRLVVGAFSSSTDTVDFYSATLQGDLHIRPSGRLRVQNSTLDGGAIRFTGGAGYLVIPSIAPLAGAGTIIADGGVGSSGVIQASGGVVTIPDTISWRVDSGTLHLTSPSGDTTGVFDVAGPMEANGGTISHLRAITTRGEVFAHAGGKIDVNQTWTNFGDMRIVDGGRLDLGGQIVNEGTVEIRNATVYLQGGSIAGPGAVTVADAIVLANNNTSLSNLMALQGERVDRGTAEGHVRLEGGAIAIGSQPGQRWVFSGGTLDGGVVNSLDGSELVTSDAFGKARLTLSNIELNANARVTTGTELTVQSTFSGTGRLIVDGGRLTLGSFGIQVMSSDVFERITPISGTIILGGGINNVGETIVLSEGGVSWRVSHGRNDGIVGGRVEGGPGAVLYIDTGYGASDFATFRQNVTLAVPLVITSSYSNAAYVREGLTLDHSTVTIGSTPASTQPRTARIHFQGPQTLSGVGEIRFTPAVGVAGNLSLPQANMIQVDSTPTGTFGLTVEEGILIRTWEGDGHVGGYYHSQPQPSPVALANHGTFLAENGHTLSLFVNDFSQQGTLRAEDDSTLVVHSTPVVPQTAFVNEGRIEAAGGKFSFTGNLDLAGSSLLQLAWAVGSEAPIDVGGAVRLGGGLELIVDDDFAPVAGDSMALLTATSGVADTFERRWLPRLDGGLYWNLSTAANTVWLQVLAGAPEGDFNSDGVVDAGDYTVWRDTDGTAAGYDAWKVNFGQSATGAAGMSAAVPEPATLWMMLAAASAVGVCRGRAEKRRSV